MGNLQGGVMFGLLTGAWWREVRGELAYFDAKDIQEQHWELSTCLRSRYFFIVYEWDIR